MELIKKLIQSKLWIKGVSDRIFALGHHKWSFYYCIEGHNIKTWHILLVNNSIGKCWYRDDHINLGLQNINICECSIISTNIYRLFLDIQNTSSSHIWNMTEDKTALDALKHGVKEPPLLYAISTKQLHLCQSPIVHLGNDIDVPIWKDGSPPVLPHMEQGSLMEKMDSHIGIISGYVAYKPLCNNHTNIRLKKQTHDKDHFYKTWIPYIYIDVRTMEVSFKINHSKQRHFLECLECMLTSQHDHVLGPALSNLLINH